MEHSTSKDQGPKAHDRISNYSLKETKVAANELSLEDAEIITALQSYVPGTSEEKRLVRKADMVLLPLLWWMYILAYLDRGNIVSPSLGSPRAQLTRLSRPMPMPQE